MSWALLTMDRLAREPGAVTIAARVRVKGGSFRGSQQNCRIHLEDGSLPGKRQRRAAAAGWGVNFAGSALVFPGWDAAPFSNKAFNARLLKLACERARMPSLWRNSPVPTAVCVLRQRKPFCDALAWQAWR